MTRSAYNRCSDSIETPYIVFNGDDDFTVPSALDECIDFLRVNPDYSAVHGVGVAATVESDENGTRVVGVGYYRQQTCEDDTAAKRLVSHYSNPVATGFTVQKVETLRPDISGHMRLKTVRSLRSGCPTA